jgi:hypothetical protein
MSRFAQIALTAGAALGGFVLAFLVSPYIPL